MPLLAGSSFRSGLCESCISLQSCLWLGPCHTPVYAIAISDAVHVLRQQHARRDRPSRVMLLSQCVCRHHQSGEQCTLQSSIYPSLHMLYQVCPQVELTKVLHHDILSLRSSVSVLAQINCTKVSASAAQVAILKRRIRQRCLKRRSYRIAYHARVDWAFGLLWASLGLPSSRTLRERDMIPCTAYAIVWLCMIDKLRPRAFHTWLRIV